MDRALLEQSIFYEAAYFAKYPDVQKAVERRIFASGKDHWDRRGEANGYDAVWVVPAEIDEDAYFLHYPKAKSLIDSGQDPEVTDAASHFRRYGNRAGFFYFRCRTVERVVERKIRVPDPTLRPIDRRPYRGRPVKITFLTPTLLGVGGVENWLRSLITKSDPNRLLWNVVLQRPNSPVRESLAESIIRAGGRIVGPYPAKGVIDAPNHVTRFPTSVDAAESVFGETDLLMGWGDSYTLKEVFSAWQKVAHGRPFITVCHGACEESLNQVARFVMGGATHVVAVSETARSAISEFFDPKVIRNGIDLSRCVPRRGRRRVRREDWSREEVGFAPLRDKFVGFLGRFNTVKNSAAAALAVAQLPANYKCILIGDSPAKSDSTIQDAVRLLGDGRLIRVPTTDQVADHLNALDVLVQASPAEGFGLSLVEAMAVGVPVVTTRVGIIPELEREFGQLVYSVPDDPTAHELAQAARDAVQVGRDADVVRRAQRVAWEHLSDEKMVVEWEDYVHSIVVAPKPKPRVSIVVPVWNEANRIEKSLRSIRNQTFSDYEVIIVDDFSQDNSPAVVKRFIEGWDKAQLICRDANGGTGAALNTGFRRVRGEYSTWWSADSWVDPRWLESLVEALDENPDSAVAYADWLDHRHGKVRFLECRDYAHVDMIGGEGIGPCWLFRTSVKDIAGEYLSIPSEDRDMHIRMAAIGPFVHVPRILGCWKSHPDNMTTSEIEPRFASQTAILQASHRLRKVQRES